MKTAALRNAPAGELRYGDQMIARRDDGMICLTDMWKATGSPPNKAPSAWVRSAASTELARVLRENMGILHVFRQQRGRTGSTWAHPIAAIGYAKHLSPEFHAWANSVILKKITQNNRLVDRYRRRGRDDTWIRQRLEGLKARKELTDILQRHGISEGVEYAICTDEVYKGLFGKSKREICVTRDLPAKSNLREHFDSPELAAVALTEAVAGQGIESQNLSGLGQCQKACAISAETIAKAVAHAKQEIEALTKLGH